MIESNEDNYDIEDQKDEMNNQDAKYEMSPDPTAPSPSSSGATYTRWGASKCPITSDLVYSGITGGSHYYQRGGGSNYLCLPKERNDVVYSKSLKYKPGVQRYSPIYGTEYENPLNGEDDSNAPCAVCQSTKSNTLMIPGTSKCPDRWTREYFGYLMSAHASYYRTTFVCVDKGQESVPNTKSNKNGALFYHAETVCTTDIPNPPYNPYDELNCVVCSK